MARPQLPEDHFRDVLEIDKRTEALERASVASTAPTVSSLPSITPFDGQEIIYRFVPSTTPTPATTIPLYWHLKWDGLVGAWLPVGDQCPLIAQHLPGVGTGMGAGSWGTYDANDPRLTVPLAGTYDLETGTGEAYWGGGTAFAGGDHLALSVSKNGNQIDGQLETGAYTLSGTGPMRIRAPYALAVGDLMRQIYFLAAGGVQTIVMRGRYVLIRPLKIT